MGWMGAGTQFPPRIGTKTGMAAKQVGGRAVSRGSERCCCLALRKAKVVEEQARAAVVHLAQAGLVGMWGRTATGRSQVQPAVQGRVVAVQFLLVITTSSTSWQPL
jgi:hypothetical protein